LRTQTGFNVQSVRRDGQPEPYHKQDQRNGTRVYFGSSSVELSPGDYTYELVYETDHQIGFFKTHDELYWNVTGNGWIFPINRVAASVTLPDGAEPNHLEAYTGPQGARGKDYTAEVVGGRAHFQTTRLLSPAEGLTIVVTWPKGFMAPPAAGEDLMRIIKANKGLAVAVFGLFLGLVYYVVAWAKVGRDPKPGTIIPLYDAPGGFSPAAVRYLAQMGFDNRTLTAAILNLAVKGKLTIHEDQAKAYTLIRTNAPTDGLAPEELALLNRLFAQGTRLAMLQANCVTLQAATSGPVAGVCHGHHALYRHGKRQGARACPVDHRGGGCRPLAGGALLSSAQGAHGSRPQDSRSNRRFQTLLERGRKGPAESGKPAGAHAGIV
jgi:hypothetical protein